MTGRKNMSWKIALAASALAILAPAAAMAETYFGFTIGVGNAPPPPRYVIVQPDLVLMPGTSVYEVANAPYETFYYGRVYYTFRDGYWYRGRSSRGPFYVTDVRSVPVDVLEVPSFRWRHHPNYTAQYGGYRQDWQQWRYRSSRQSDWRDREYWRDRQSSGDWRNRPNDRDWRDRQDGRTRDVDRRDQRNQDNRNRDNRDRDNRNRDNGDNGDNRGNGDNGDGR
jgi:hypothetical protein